MSKFKVGDRVVVESPVADYGRGLKEKTRGWVGMEGVVVAAADSMGDYLIEFGDDAATYVSAEGLLLMDDLDRLAEERAPGALESDEYVEALRDLLNEEVRVVSETGGEKGRKWAELGSVDPLALIKLAEVSGMGARKYEAFNFLRGYEWSLSFNAMMRHALAFWNGEDVDEESGLPHITHAAWHALALTSFMERKLGTDDRFKREGE